MHGGADGGGDSRVGGGGGQQCGGGAIVGGSAVGGVGRGLQPKNRPLHHKYKTPKLFELKQS